MTKPFVISFITCTIVLSCFLSPVALSFQNAQAVRFDAFGDIQVSDKIARLDNFAITLQNSPNTHGFIIVYRSRRDLPGLSSRLASEMKNYLVSSRGIEAGRIITVDGGAASCLDQELWIVPPNTAPTMREDI